MYALNALKVWKKPKYNFLVNKCLSFLYLYFGIYMLSFYLLSFYIIMYPA